MTFNFEKLEVWKLAMELVDRVYDVAKKYPDEEKFGLAQQLKKSVTSIPLNIAEGSIRGKKEFSQFIRIALGSLVETVTNLKIGHMRGFIKHKDHDENIPLIEELYFKLLALHKSLTKKDSGCSDVSNNLKG
jgi:four helix bundle protein